MQDKTFTLAYLFSGKYHKRTFLILIRGVRRLKSYWPAGRLQTVGWNSTILLYFSCAAVKVLQPHIFLQCFFVNSHPRVTLSLMISSYIVLNSGVLLNWLFSKIWFWLPKWFSRTININLSFIYILYIYIHMYNTYSLREGTRSINFLFLSKTSAFFGI